MEKIETKMHPAAQWATEQLKMQAFNQTAVDCTTTVVLKILDGKCKMLPGEMTAIMEIYDVIRSDTSKLFNQGMFKAIEIARTAPTPSVVELIHELRIYAEENIPKSSMKKYKIMLREGLFG